MKTPDYVLTDVFTYKDGTLPAGTFVKPIQYCYLPQHVKDDGRWGYVSLEDNVFCYCSLGIVPIPRKIVRQT